MKIGDKPKPNYKPVDLQVRSAQGYSFQPGDTPAMNSALYPKFMGMLAEKNFADLIQNDDIRNKNASYIIGGRLFEAVVDAAGTGDYTTIQQALDAGQKRIFIRNGTYVLKEDLIILSDILIVGEDKYNTIIDCNNSSHQITITSEALYSTGTITTTVSSNVITGSGTSWSSNLSIGDYIVFNNNIYTITAVNSNTEIEINEIYNGRTESSVAYKAGLFLTNINLENFTIQNQNLSTQGEVIDINGLINSTIKNIIIKDCDNAYSLGFDIVNFYKNNVENLDVSNCGLYGIRLNGGCSYNIFDNLFANNNGYSGIHIRGTYNIFSNIYVGNNHNSGLSLSIAHNNEFNNIIAHSNYASSGGAIYILSSDKNNFNYIQSYNSNENGIYLAFSNENIFTTIHIENSQESGFYFYSHAKRNIVLGGVLKNNGLKTNNTYSHIKFDAFSSDGATYSKIIGLSIISDVANKAKYGIEEEDSNCDYNYYGGISFEGMATSNIILSGVNSIIGDII